MLLLIFLADLAGAGGPRVKRVSMELGGNAPSIDRGVCIDEGTECCC